MSWMSCQCQSSALPRYQWNPKRWGCRGILHFLSPLVSQFLFLLLSLVSKGGRSGCRFGRLGIFQRGEVSLLGRLAGEVEVRLPAYWHPNLLSELTLKMGKMDGNKRKKLSAFFFLGERQEVLTSPGYSFSQQWSPFMWNFLTCTGVCTFDNFELGRRVRGPRVCLNSGG